MTTKTAKVSVAVRCSGGDGACRANHAVANHWHAVSILRMQVRSLTVLLFITVVLGTCIKGQFVASVVHSSYISFTLPHLIYSSLRQ